MPVPQGPERPRVTSTCARALGCPAQPSQGVGSAIFSLRNRFSLLESLWAGPLRTVCPRGQVTWLSASPVLPNDLVNTLRAPTEKELVS